MKRQPIRWMAFLGCLLAIGATGARAQCLIEGECTAQLNPDDPDLGAWKYSLTIAWDSGTQHALSHTDLLLALEDCPGLCQSFPFAAPDTAGQSSGDDPCTVYYYAVFNCHGDPSIHETRPLVKFEPIDDPACGPGPSGTGTFFFYSDWGPVPVPASNDLLAFKAGLQVCYGPLSGVVPGCNNWSLPHVCCVGEACFVVLDGECEILGGEFHPEWDACGPNPCAVPHVCCAGEVCSLVLEDECQGLGGEFHPEWSACAPNPCAVPRVCCVDHGCTVTTQDECAAMGGVFHPEWDSCGSVDPCQILPAEKTSWGSLKSRFR